MSILDEMAQDHQEAESDWGSKVITWNGTDYPCVPGNIDAETQIEIGGNPVDIAGEFMCRKAVFPSSTPPETGDLVTHDGVEYRVALVRDIQDTIVRIAVIDPEV